MGWKGRESRCCCALHSFWITVTDIIFSDRSLPVAAVTWGAGVCAQMQTLCVWRIGKNSSVAHRASHTINKRCQNILFGCFSGPSGALNAVQTGILFNLLLVTRDLWGGGGCKSRWTKNRPSDYKALKLDKLSLCSCLCVFVWAL